MPNHKTKAEHLENRIINSLAAHERRAMATIRLAVSDLHRAVRSLESRSEWLENRREPDPLIREAARREAEHCRRIALLIADSARGAK